MGKLDEDKTYNFNLLVDASKNFIGVTKDGKWIYESFN